MCRNNPSRGNRIAGSTPYLQINLRYSSHVPPFLFSDDEPKGYFNHEPAVRRHLLAQIRRLDKEGQVVLRALPQERGGLSDEEVKL